MENSIRALIASFVAMVFTILSIFNFSGLAPSVNTDEQSTIKNVIFMIGDGMGDNTLRMAEQYAGKTLTVLDPDNTADTWNDYGHSQTRSASSTVTDSAAGATALSCGVRTTNSFIGVYFQDPMALASHPASVTEMAQYKGLRTGIITSDDSYGATPAGFSVHAASRTESELITKRELACGVDLYWTAGSSYATADAAKAAGREYIDNEAAAMALTDPDVKTWGSFDKDTLWQGTQSDTNPTLSELTGKALNLLNTDNDNGFFIMIEGAHIDKNSHQNNKEGCTEAVFEFDKAVSSALDFAKADGHTLVVVTADHETGGITKNASTGVYEYTKTSHSATDVPIFVYGSDSYLKSGETVMNIQLADRTAAALGFGSDSFPLDVSGSQSIAAALRYKQAAAEESSAA